MGGRDQPVTALNDLLVAAGSPGLAHEGAQRRRGFPIIAARPVDEQLGRVSDLLVESLEVFGIAHGHEVLGVIEPAGCCVGVCHV